MSHNYSSKGGCDPFISLSMPQFLWDLSAQRIYFSRKYLGSPKTYTNKKGKKKKKEYKQSFLKT